MNFHALYQWASLLMLAVSCGVALWRGGWPERWSGGAMILAWIATAFAQKNLQLWGPQTGVMIVDILLLAVLLVVAMRSDRWWPLWASGFHGLAVMLHFAVAIDPDIWGRAYYVASAIFGYLTLGTLLVGAILRPARRLKISPAD